MTDIYITSIQLENHIERLACDSVQNVQIYDQYTNIKLTNLLKSFQSFHTVSFVEVSRLPIWFYLGHGFDVYTEDDVSLEFFKKTLRLVHGKDLGLLIRCEGSLDDGTGGGSSSNPSSKMDLKDFHLLLIADDELKFKLVPLQMTSLFIEAFIKKCGTSDGSGGSTSNATNYFIEPQPNNENEILTSFAEKKKSMSAMNSFIVTGSFGPGSIGASAAAAASVPQSSRHGSVAFQPPPSSLSAQPIRKNMIIDRDMFKKNVLNIINSELRLRNITKDNKDYQSILNHTYKMTFFAFRKQLSEKVINIKIDQMRDVVIKLMDILV